MKKYLKDKDIQAIEAKVQKISERVADPHVSKKMADNLAQLKKK
jgi:hypothetical protein